MLCALPGCNLPVHVDAKTGFSHNYCGRQHAKQALGREVAEPHGYCHVCKLPGCHRPVFFEASSGRVHDFCCHTHALQAMNSGSHPRSNRGTRADNAGLRCALPGCTATRFRDETTGRLHDYCGRTHAFVALSRGLAPPYGSDATDIYKTFRGRAGEPQYTISVLNNTHPKVDGIKRQFDASWAHPGPKPTVVRVLQVRNAAEIYERYRQYALNKGTEVRRWHGTSLRCSFGIDIEQPPCADPHCAVCSIFARSFDVALAGTSAVGGLRRALRYGGGIYFSKCSSKSNDYANPSERAVAGERYRVMFLCRVSLGRVYHASVGQIPDISGIINPLAYDSIVGLTTAEGGELNYEETVVYSGHAAIPSYLVVYRSNS